MSLRHRLAADLRAAFVDDPVLWWVITERGRSEHRQPDGPVLTRMRCPAR